MRNEEYLNEKIKHITEDEVIKLFKDEFGADMNEYSHYDIQYKSVENENYEVKSQVDRHGGEGQGEEYWVVSRVLDKRTNEVFFIQFDGYYTSWDGTDWSENYWNIVEPKEVKVIKWL